MWKPRVKPWGNAYPTPQTLKGWHKITPRKNGHSTAQSFSLKVMSSGVREIYGLIITDFEFTGTLVVHIFIRFVCKFWFWFLTFIIFFDIIIVTANTGYSFKYPRMHLPGVVSWSSGNNKGGGDWMSSDRYLLFFITIKTTKNTKIRPSELVH